MKKQTEITDDIIKNKFDEILSSKNIEEQQIMGFNNIDEIKKYEFFRDSFVKKFKASIEDQSKYIEIFSSDIYYDIFKISLDSISVIVKAINQGDYDLVDSLLTALDIKPNIIAASECDVGSLLYLACINNQKETARLLLKKGANIDFGGALDASPLCGAIVAGHLDIANPIELFA